MRKQIIYLFFLFFYSLQSCQTMSAGNNAPVLQNKKQVGLINQTTDVKCDSCYTLRTVKIEGKNLTFRIPVSSNTINSKPVFQEDYELLSEQSKDGWLIKYNSRYNSTSYVFRVGKNKNNPVITKVSQISSSVNHHKIAENDYVDYPAISICDQKGNYILPQNQEINLSQYFISSDKNCFLCPSSYSVEECLEKKKINAKFKWQ